MLHKYFTILYILVFLHGIGSAQHQLTQKLQTGLDAIQQNHVPDRRVAVFEVTHTQKDNIWTLSGETSSTEALEEIQTLAGSLLPESHKFEVELLPAAGLGDRTKAVTHVSVAVLRGARGHTNEMVDQVVMGTELTIMKIQGGWAYVQTPYGYLGWMTRGSFTQMGKKEFGQWESARKISVSNLNANIYEEPSAESRVLRDAVLNSRVKYISSEGDFIRVQLPNGNHGFLETRYAGDVISIDNALKPDTHRVIETAHRMHGLPYIWGGNSTKGFDCSGFTQTVFETAGYQLPRDASQQVLVGREITPDETYSNVEPGDLIFFGPRRNRITHVGISLGGGRYIHASGHVKINSLLEGDDNYKESRRNTLQVINRVE